MLSGIVVHGHQLGRLLGFPTANLCTSHLTGQIPSPGVYAAWTLLSDGSRYASMVNIGYRPTVDSPDHDLSVEVHLLDFAGDLYDTTISVDFVCRIRDERKMDSLEQLKQQLATDLLCVRQSIL